MSGPQHFLGEGEKSLWIAEKGYGVMDPEMGMVKLTLEELADLVRIVQSQLPELALDLPAYTEGFDAGVKSVQPQKPEMRTDKDSPFVAAEQMGRQIGYRNGYEVALQRMKGMLVHILETPQRDATDDAERREDEPESV